MNLTDITKTEVFADWLSVTCSPESSFMDSVQYALDSMGGAIISIDKAYTYSLGNGTVRLQRTPHFHSVSISGGSLSRIRELRKLEYLLSCISEVPHSITRLDVAIDTAQDGADVIDYYHKRFSKSSRYPKLSRKTVEPSYMLNRRASDDRMTGTVYIGHTRGTKVSARIYDKQAELLQKTGAQVPLTTRYELTVRKDMQPSLRDVFQPSAIFWHYMGKTLIKAPYDVPTWEHGWGGSWNMQVEKPLVYQVLKSKIQDNPELQRIFELADSMSPDGRDIAINMIRRSHLEGGVSLGEVSN